MANEMGSDSCFEEFRVPKQFVPLLIGRGGEQLTQLQAKSGCRIRLSAHLNSSIHDEAFTLSGSIQAINCAKALMTQLIDQCSMPLHYVRNRHLPNGDIIVDMPIPGPKVAALIGKRGETLWNLQIKASAKMHVLQGDPRLPLPKRQATLRISGQPDNCQYAQQLVMDFISGMTNEVQSQQMDKQKQKINCMNDKTEDPVHTNEKRAATSAGDVTKQCLSTPSRDKEGYQQKECAKQIENAASPANHICEFCKKGEHIFQEITQLVENVLGKPQFKCQTCSRSFSTEKLFLNHLNTRIGKDCDKTYISYGLNLEKQIKMKDKQNDGSVKNHSQMTFICDFCPKSIGVEINIFERSGVQQEAGINENLNFLKCNVAETVANASLRSSPTKNINVPTKEPCLVSTVNANAPQHIPDKTCSSIKPLTQPLIAGTSKSCNKTSSITINKIRNDKKIVCDICLLQYTKLKRFNRHLRRCHNIIPNQNQQTSSKTLNSQGSINRGRSAAKVVATLKHKKLLQSSSCGKDFQTKVTENPDKVVSQVMCEQKKSNTNQQSGAGTNSEESTTLDKKQFNVEEFATDVLSQCERSDKSLSKIESNAAKVSGDFKTFTCCICSWKCTGANNILTHFLSHVQDKSYLQKSKQMSDILKRKERVEVHLTKVKNEPDVIESILHPNNSGKGTGSPSRVKTVADIKRTTDSSTSEGKSFLLYLCKICLLNFKSLGELNKHTDEHFKTLSHQTDHSLLQVKRQKMDDQQL